MALRILGIITKGRNVYGHLDGFLYVKSDAKGDVTYWKCRRKKDRSARLTTVSTGRNIMIRKGKPLVYALLETKMEEAYSKVIEVTLSKAETAGKKVKDLPRSNQQRAEDRISNIVNNYRDYADNGTESEYIKTIGYYIHM